MTIKNITVPDIGGATDVIIIEVLVKVGDTIKVDTSLLTLESDKATMEVPSSDEGIVKEVKVKVGDKVSQGSVILALEVANTAAVAAVDNKKPVASPSSSSQNKPQALLETVSLPSTVSAQTRDGVHAGPVVRKMAYEFGIDLTKVSPTGSHRRISKEDISNYIKTRLAQTTSGSGLPMAPTVDFTKFGSVEVQTLSRIKKISGKNLHRNWLLVPHVTQFGEADITEMEAFRVEQKEKHGLKLTPLVFIMKVVASALEAFPQFNASLDASGENIILKKYFHIGVAVDTPDGLVVPVIRDVDKKGLIELAKELSEVSEKARNKLLTANDMQGGCFSISSLGGIGGTAFTPIVNMPEVAILGVSKSSLKPIYQEGQWAPRVMLPLSLSYDHRVIDGAEGARFITHLSTRLSETWSLLL